MPSNTDTLLPCPFCGNRAFSYAMDGGYVAECEGCACRTSICDSRGVEAETWNTRPTTDVSTDVLVALIEALDPHRYIEGIGSQKWLDACHNMAPHAYKLRDQLKALQRSNAEKDEALKTVVAQFESDFCIEGVIVDDPPKTFIIAYQDARKALGDKTP